MNAEELQNFLKKHWYYVAGGLVVAYFLYSYIGTATTSTAATDIPPNQASLDAASLSAGVTQSGQQVALQLAQTQAGAAVDIANLQATASQNIATVQAQQAVEINAILASANEYNTTIGAAAQVTNTANAAVSNENVAALNALGTSSAAFFQAAGTETATAAGATGQILGGAARSAQQAYYNPSSMYGGNAYLNGMPIGSTPLTYAPNNYVGGSGSVMIA